MSTIFVEGDDLYLPLVVGAWQFAKVSTFAKKEAHVRPIGVRTTCLLSSRGWDPLSPPRPPPPPPPIVSLLCSSNTARSLANKPDTPPHPLLPPILPLVPWGGGRRGEVKRSETLSRIPDQKGGKGGNSIRLWIKKKLFCWSPSWRWRKESGGDDGPRGKKWGGLLPQFLIHCCINWGGWNSPSLWTGPSCRRWPALSLAP